jgi:2-dehydro-3-deoxygluconokinase
MKIMTLGEAMLEYRSTGQSRDGLHYGGDTLNTAVHMARLGCAVSYVTALGCDPLSDALIADWEREGLDTRLVLRHPERHPGIYAIHLDARGERSFLYWRDRSAARELFSLASIDSVVEAIAQADLFYFSHVSLAVLPPAGRAALIAAAEKVRAKRGLVAYDSNFRPRLWESPTSARIWSDRATSVAAIGLPTLEDELALHDKTANAEQIAHRWHELGCAEVVIKRGSDGPLFSAKGASAIAYPCEQLAMIDSSGAGDAFNAGYLAVRMQGKHPPEAVQAGHALAAWVITQPGALPSLSADAPYDRWQGTGARVAAAKV